MGRLRLPERSDDPSVADLRVVMLVEQRTHDVIYELVLTVGDVEAKGDDEEDERGNKELADYLEKNLKEFLHNAIRLS
jgi:hypothetical protein